MPDDDLVTEFVSVALGSLILILDDGQLIVDHADPHVMVSNEFLCDVHDHRSGYNLRLEPPVSPTEPWLQFHYHNYEADPWPCQPWGNPSSRCWVNWLLHVDADQHLVYRIETYDLERHAWRASWPD